jgi:hypothetical protein
MKTLRCFTLSLLTILFFVTISAAQDVTWYGFDQDFINAKYGSSAIGSLLFKKAHPASTVHSSSCGGKDAELHIGMTLPEVTLSSDQMPLTDSPASDDEDWGLVAELPNAKNGDGKAKLAQLKNKPITFFGYFRVWDEGHGQGQVFASNPHHVFEIHPAWGFTGTGVNFMRKDLVTPMNSYRGFGATKFKPLFKSLTDEEWPLAFQSNGVLHIGLLRFSNFFQLPVRVKSISSVDGGHEVTVDVFSNNAMTNLVYSGLTAITATGTPIDNALSVGQKALLLGFLSVNLKKVLDASNGADSEENAVAVKDAVEFFVFGIAVNPAVQSCSN